MFKSTRISISLMFLEEKEKVNVSKGKNSSIFELTIIR
jgi:hypothetical protein